jgi:proteasome alpha subunit
MSLEAAVRFASAALAAGSPATNGDNAAPKLKLEVAVLDRARPKRAFRRIEGAALTALLPPDSSDSTDEEPAASPDASPDSSDEA